MTAMTAALLKPGQVLKCQCALLCACDLVRSGFLIISLGGGVWVENCGSLHQLASK